MKKLPMLLWGAVLAGMQPAHALINDGKFNSEPGELFISIFNDSAQKSYYKDLGITMAQFLKGEGCIPDFSADANFAAFKGQAFVYNIAAVYPLARDAAGNPVNLTTWGYLATSSQGAPIFNANWGAIDNTKQKIQGYIGNLNVDAFTGTAAQTAENKSGVFGPTDPGYHGNPTWGSNLGGSVNGNTEGAPGQALEFFFVNNTNGTDSGKQVSKLGAWTLSGDGKLSYAGTGTSAACVTTVANKAPVAAVAASTITVDVNTLVTLDGSPSSDPDNGPQPLTYAWKQTSTPAVTLTNATQAKASFTPTQAATYTFELTVSDGKDSAKTNVTVTAKTPLPTGPAITLTSPTTWQAKKKGSITWTTNLVDARMAVKVRFSKNGGAKFKTINATVKSSKGRINWKPAKGDVTTQGILEACVKPAKGIKTPVCNRQNITVSQ